MDSVRSSRRRLRVSIDPLAVVLALALASTSDAQQPSAEARKSAALDAFLGDVKSLTADFKQEIYGADQHLLETQTGKLSLLRPNRFRWTAATPTGEQMIVADGKKLWMYDVDLKQVTVTPLDDTPSSSPALLLSGNRDVRDEFNVVETYTRDGLDWVRLEPKAGGSDFTSVQIAFEGKSPRRLELVDGLNETTRISFMNVVVNPPDLTESLFDFRAPADVNVLGGGKG
jgi:outer membrane lipoprotein carrier protein